jgi:hypothetical protein
MSDTKSFQVIVNEVNSAPVLTVPGNQSISEGSTLNVSASATDSDIPTNTLEFSLVSAPSGVAINTNTGAISWPTTETDGPSTNTITVRVTDNGSPPMSDTKSFQVIVNEVNSAPVLTVPGDQTIGEGSTLNVSASAVDADIPTNTLTFSLVTAPTGFTINTNSGAMSWTPTELQGGSNYLVTVKVDDNGTPNLSDTKSFHVQVDKVNSAPILTVPTNQVIDELLTLNVSASATDSDIPTNTLVFRLDSPPAGMTIDTNTGAISWTPTEEQGPSTNTITVVVTDDGTPPMSATNSFVVYVNEVNAAPHLPTQTNLTINANAALTVTNTATDSDIPSNHLSYALSTAPGGALINTNGIITWTAPAVTNFTTNAFVTVVTDDGIPPMSYTNEFFVTVVPLAGAPTILSVTYSNSTATVSWTSVAGYTYQLQYKEWLSDTNWLPVTPNIPATNTTTSMSDSVGSAEQRLYRVRLIP